MAILAVQSIRKMRGGSQAQLMLGEDESLWVVKFQNNPVHVRILANELIASRLAAAIGLSTPETEIIDVGPWVCTESNALVYELGIGKREQYLPGLQFGSRFVGGLMPGSTVDYLPDPQLSRIHNLAEFAGILAFDKWTTNCDARQAVFTRKPRQSKYSASFIDQGFCFNAGGWNFPDAPLRGIYRRNIVYWSITGWHSFSPWLERIEGLPASLIGGVIKSVPPEWYGNDAEAIEQLADKLLARRCRVRDSILEFKESDRHPFPNWTLGADSPRLGTRQAVLAIE